MRLASWNVLAEPYVRRSTYGHLSTRPDPERRRAQVRQKVAELAETCDVVALCEVTSLLARELATDDGLSVIWAPHAGKPAGQALVSRQPLHETQVHHLPQGQTAVSARSSGVTVCSVHFKWVSPGTSLHPADQALAALANLPASPLVIAGDFNREAAEFAPPPSLTVHAPQGPTALVNGSRRCCIDLVATRGISVLSMAIDAALTHPVPSRRFPSDHLPVLTKVAAFQALAATRERQR